MRISAVSNVGILLMPCRKIKAKAAMVEQIRALEIALDAMPVAVSWASLEDQRILYMNRMFRQTFGYTLEDVPTIGDWIATYPEEADRVLAGRRWHEAIDSFDGTEACVQEMEITVRCKNGTVKTMLHGGVLLPGANWALATFVDISERKRNELRLLEAEQRARGQQVLQAMLLEHSQEMIVISQKDPSRRAVSPGVLNVTGYTPEEYLKLDLLKFSHPGDHARGTATLQRVMTENLPQTLQMRVRRKDGGWRWIEARLRPYTDPMTGEVQGYIANIIDISERKEQEDRLIAEKERLQQLADLARVDELTGLANRRAFNETFAREAARHTRGQQELALLLVDIDNFKNYNDHYGHLEGDACLRDVAEAMRKTMGRASDLIARFGGEEFVVLLPLTERRGAEKLAQSLLKAVRAVKRPHPRSEHGLVTVSVGGACWPAQITVDQQRLIEEADRALYAAKHGGRNQACFTNFERT